MAREFLSGFKWKLSPAACFACESAATMERQPVGGHTPSFEATVALTVLKNDRTIAQLAEQFGLHANRIGS
jgi:hypothetical protein